MWRLRGAFLQAVVGALAAPGAEQVAPTKLAAHTTTITTRRETLRTSEVNMYSTVYDAVLARVLIAAGQPEPARERLDIALALAQDTGMCFYNAEL
jgi:hypothetical protein